MRMLDRKALRDALHLKGQLLAIAVLVACGVAVFIMLRSMNGYLRESQASYYERYGFGELFAHATRAPAGVELALRDLPELDRVETRIVRDVLLDVPGLSEPATGRLVSLPTGGVPSLNRLHLRSGRLPEPGRREEVVLSAALAGANGLREGDELGAVLNGRWQRLVVVGSAIAPEFVYEISGYGAPFPDNRRFGAVWMNETAMAAAFEMEGAFNDVVATLRTGASEGAALAAMDRLLAPYGGTGAYTREHHLSHTFLTSEIEETQITASFFPALFMIVTAFLLHTTLLRLVRMEREQIGLLKAFGVRSTTVALHYVELALLPVLAGSLAGSLLGGWLAHRMAGVYARFYQFPQIGFELDLKVVWTAIAIALVTGVAGALAAARSVVRLAPAVAMAPPAPPTYRHGGLEATRLWRPLGPTGRMIARSLLRARGKSLSTVTGIALSLGVLCALLGMFDSVDVVADLAFNQTYRDDVAVYFESPRSPDALTELARMPGVLRVEPVHVADVRLVSGHRERRVGLLGLEPGTELRRIVDARYTRHLPPVEGLLLNRAQAERLALTPGDTVRVEVVGGRRRSADLVVTGLVDELMGGEAYASAETLQRLVAEGPRVAGAWLRVDAAGEQALYDRLKRTPGVAGVLVHDVLVSSFEETIEESFLIALLSTLVLGAALVMAIVYNQARVALSERGRDLASLRVLGFTRRDVAGMLLGEQGALVLLALPLGLVLGWLLTLLMMLRFETELFRLPVVVEPGTYLFAVAIVLVAAVLSALLVRRRLDRIDLIGVLKTRE